MPKKDEFKFEISLSVLNHLGRNLYRSFITVLGEAISNSWDADADDVWIYVDRKSNSFIIKDNGLGMTGDDFQGKFLKIGYSKRKDGTLTSQKGRPFIGRKGIGKLALLSCADKISILSKTEKTNYIGGVINNSNLDDAIKNDLTPDKYSLENVQKETFGRFTDDHEQGTIIHFDNIKEEIKNTIDYLKKIIALYFKFSLVDSSFNIYVEDELITIDHLNDLAEKTEFCWNINNLSDPYLNEKLTSDKLKENVQSISTEADYNGFIASVGKPRDLKIITTEERVSIDLFVNGRLREKNILSHRPTSRITENYLYGQIHFNGLDDNEDRFATGREGIVSEDPKYRQLLDDLKDNVIGVILADWDRWRRKHREDGDPEDTSIPPKQRKSEELYNEVSKEYTLVEEAPRRNKVDTWVDELAPDASFNFASYADCFLSENLIRKYIRDESLDISRVESEVTDKKEREETNKQSGNINIDLRQSSDDLSYLDIKHLADVADKPGRANCLQVDAKQYKPIRDALMHTALLTTDAKEKLTAVYKNIKGRIISLLSSN